MKITVFGLRQIGSVIAACAAKHFLITGLDNDETVVAKLTDGHAPIFEPRLDNLLADQIEARRLRFTTNAILACLDADVLWVACEPSPLDDAAGSAPPIVEQMRRVLPNLAPGTLVLISSTLLADECAGLQTEYPQFHFAAAPLNLRPGHAIEDFEKIDHVIVGIRDDSKLEVIERLFDPFTDRTVFLPLRSAGMVQHLLDASAARAARDRAAATAKFLEVSDPEMLARAAV